MEVYPAPRFASQVPSWPAGGRPAQPQTRATAPVSVPVQRPQPLPAARPTTPPAPRYRAQAPEEPTEIGRPVGIVPPQRASLNMPSPEQLGVAPARPAAEVGLDWSTAHRRLDRLGAVCFHMEKLPRGGVRVTCLLPTAQPDRSHRIEAEAGSEIEAVQIILDRAETWSATARHN